jgi:TPR repeat protein
LCFFGRALEKGYNGKTNLSEAMKYLKMSADLGNSDGMNCYGMSHAEGDNGKKNLSKAMKYYKMSADLGDHLGPILYHLSVSILQNQ